MKRSIGILLVVVGTLFPLGCGGQSESNKSANNGASSRTPGGNVDGRVPPNEIVAMFSDSIRRGDKETTIKLITLAAREEIQRRGMTIDPPGSPGSSYKIGEVRFLDNDRDAAYVESLWIEPGENGQPNQETEVVWAVQLEPEGWRISGLAIDMGPNQQPTLVDFENLEVGAVENSAGATANTAPAATTNPSAGNVAQPSSGFQTPPSATSNVAIPATTVSAPTESAFKLPDLPPQISQPPNTQFR